MTDTRKFSGITMAGSPPASNDTVVGVTAGGLDTRWTREQIGAPLFAATIQLSQSQLATLFSAPVQLGLPLPGSGKIIMPLAIATQYKGGAAAFANTGDVEVSCNWAGQTVTPSLIKIPNVLGDEYSQDSFTAPSGIIPSEVANVDLQIFSGADLGIWGPIASASVTSGQGGQQYVVGDTETITGTNSDDAIVTIASVNHGGSGNSIGDIFTIHGGTGDATVTALTVDGSGAVLSLHNLVGGTTYTSANNIGTTSSGSGIGPTLDITASSGPVSAAILSATGGSATGLTLSNPGTSYTTATGLSTSAITGTGTGLEVSTTVSTAQTGTMQVNLLYTVIDLKS